MNKTYIRKITLLCIIVVLLVIYILQLVFSARTSIRRVETEADFDSIVVTKGDDTLFTITKSGDTWLYGDKPVMENRANGLVNSVNEITLLERISSNTDDLERYGLNPDNVIKVTASAGGEVVRTLFLGKISTAGGQCYVMLDDDKNIYLAQGALRSTFEVDINTILEKEEEDETQAGATTSADDTAETDAAPESGTAADDSAESAPAEDAEASEI